MKFTKIKNFLRMISVFEFRSLLNFYWLKYMNRKDSTRHNFSLKNGLRISVNKDAGDLTTLFEIFVNNDYSFSEDSLHRFNILDIGANVGYFSLFISRKFPDANVYSFEPFPDTFKRLGENIKNNSALNISAYQLAVSNFNGNSDFFSFDWAGCNTLIDRKYDVGHHKIVRVECISFDDIFEKTGVKNFLFGKIDCEGSEYDIFLNSKDKSIRLIRDYIVEVHAHTKYSKQDLMDRFRNLGYTVKEKDNLLAATLK